MTQFDVIIVDDDDDVRDSLRALLESANFRVLDFDSAHKVLSYPDINETGCLISDIRMPGMDGLALQQTLVERGVKLPIILITGHGDVPLAVRAMKAGALDFIEKPFDDEHILASVKRALASAGQAHTPSTFAQTAAKRIAKLTEREREVLQHLIEGRPNKLIAHEMGISPRTVEIHRAHVMDKMEAKSLSDLVRQGLAAGIASA